MMGLICGKEVRLRVWDVENMVVDKVRSDVDYYWFVCFFYLFVY